MSTTERKCWKPFARKEHVSERPCQGNASRQPLAGLTHSSAHWLIYLSVHPLSLNPFFCLPTYWTIHQSIHYPSILPSTHYPLIHLSIHLSVYSEICQPRYPSVVHPSVYWSTSPLIFPPTHYFMRSTRNYRDRAVTNRYDFCFHGSDGLVGDMCANQSVHHISANSDATYLRIGTSTSIEITSGDKANMCEIPG